MSDKPKSLLYLKNCVFILFAYLLFFLHTFQLFANKTRFYSTSRPHWHWSNINIFNLSALKLTIFYHLIFPLSVFFFFCVKSAHLAMIDTLMMAYTVETASVEKVTACIRQYSSYNPEVDSPYDTEDAVTSWINTVCTGYMHAKLHSCKSCSLNTILFYSCINFIFNLNSSRVFVKCLIIGLACIFHQLD